ncbi:hypothetical protein SAMN05216330_105485 [Bradyrhizobium sp. Ghvi]|nr:hypothetical protein SAMN05216330_105485 [Bradyrhizobium sp. Ghvi]
MFQRARGGSISGYYNAAFRAGKTTTSVLTPSSLYRLKSAAIPAARMILPSSFTVYLEPFPVRRPKTAIGFAGELR